MNTSKTVGNQMRRSAFIVPLYIVVIVFFCATLVRTWRDFMTSWYGVQLLGQASMGSPFEDLISNLALAIVPQTLGLIAVYAFLSIDITANRQSMISGVFALVVAALMIALDVYTGYVFYNQGQNPLFFSLIGDTLFSEFGVSFALGLLLELRFDFSRGVAKFLKTDKQQASKPQPGRQEMDRPR